MGRFTNGLNAPRVIVAAVELRRYIIDLLVAAGCRSIIACIAADVFVEADLRGHEIQGIDHIFTTLDGLISGQVNGRVWPLTLFPRPAMIQIDGRKGLGQIAGVIAAKHIINVARRTGCAVAAITNTDDLFMLGYYTNLIAKRGLVAFAMISTFPFRVHSPGGIDPVLGTNPIAFAAPLGGDQVFLFDCAPASVAIGDVRMASYQNDSLPYNCAIDRNGEPTTDPNAALGGALSPYGFAEFGLGLCAALIGGPYRVDSLERI
jgi:LDH2 family malate/lactate/ureidoglycolate dehydrogenase